METSKKVLTFEKLSLYDQKLKAKMSDDDSQTLEAAKEYVDSLSDNYDAAGTAQTKMEQLSNGQVKLNKEAIEKLNGDSTVVGSIANTVVGAKDELQNEIGTLGNLNTTVKDNLVNAVNEVRSAVAAGGTNSAITISTDTTSEGFAKSYTIKQGDSTVGVIDIPKDMVVSSGTVEENPDGKDAGTYLVLTLANATNDKVYINVGKLVDIYSVQDSATQIQLAINPLTREISATIVAGSISATELASDSVTTIKIADGNVTKGKLSADVQASLSRADSALQASDIEEITQEDIDSLFV